ncbi:hypothetical protein ACIRG5_26215 [Lentzea sp. NPDC102401]|uniref:hypothetical protein n=1 Tax=Lentzea sp. NPDC102401 TaxID=3364128 RepID=UPI0037FCDADF
MSKEQTLDHARWCPMADLRLSRRKHAPSDVEMALHQQPRNSDLAGLTSLLGRPVVAQGLVDWAELSGRAIEPSVDAWLGKGYTGAITASLTIRGRDTPDEPPEGDRNVVAKVISRAERSEIAVHQAALDQAPADFMRSHLVQLRYGPVQIDRDTVVYFQDLAGRSSRYRPAKELAERLVELTDLCCAVVDDVATEWNLAPRGAKTSVWELAHQELHHPVTTNGSVRRLTTMFGMASAGARVLLNDGADPLANPWLLMTDRTEVGARKLEVLRGQGHGDLHLGNVLVLINHSGVVPKSYCLIDLATYQATAPRGRDPITLLLSVVSVFWPTLMEHQRRALLGDLTRPDLKQDARQDQLLGGLVTRVFKATLNSVESNGFEQSWRVQYPVELAAAALRSTTFEDYPADLRWWLVELACRATQAHLDITGQQLPEDKPQRLNNPFVDAADPRTPQAPIPGAGEGKYPVDGTLIGRRSGTKSNEDPA